MVDDTHLAGSPGPADGQKIKGGAMRYRVDLGLLRATFLTLSLCFSSIPIFASDDLLRITGTGSAYGTMKRLAEAFSNVDAKQKFDVQRPVGSDGAIRALIDGKVEVAVANRMPSAQESAARSLQATRYGCSPFVVAVHRDLRLGAVTSAQLAAMYADDPRLPDGRRARPVLRITDATENRLLAALAPAVAQAVEAANKRPGMINADTDLAAADLIERTPGGFGPSSLAVIESERRPLVALTIDGKVPTVAGNHSGAYPWRKDMFLITSADAPSAVRRFVAFVLSSEARAVLQATGHSTRCP